MHVHAVRYMISVGSHQSDFPMPAFVPSLAAPRFSVLQRVLSHQVGRDVCTKQRRRRSTISATMYRLAPSDFAFLWEECKRCFYLKVHGILPRPRAPFPSIFSKIDLCMKRRMSGLQTNSLIPDMRPGKFLCEEEDPWIECLPITPPGHKNSVYIRGKVRSLVLH